MSLKDRIAKDNHRVFMNKGHYADMHTWNGIPFTCVTDEESALKRKNNNVNDVSWDNNTREILIYVPTESLPGRAEPNEFVLFDNRQMKVPQVNEDMGMLSIVLVANYPKAVEY